MLRLCVCPTTPSQCIAWEQGWRSGLSTRLPPVWPRFDSRTRRHMWVEFVVGSLPCSEGFSLGSPVFRPPHSTKTNVSKFQFNLEGTAIFEQVSRELFGAPWVNKLHLHFYYLFLHILHSP